MSDWNGFGSLDLSSVEAESGRRSMRPGSYICKITNAEVRDTKDKKGKGLVVEFAEVNGGGTCDDWINIKSQSAEAERIGLQKLKALLVAAGHPNPDRPGDVNTIKGLTVGVRIEQSEDWTDREGRVRPGGGKVRRSGAYFPPGDVNESIGPSREPVRPRAQTTSQRAVGNPNYQLNDEIPF